jgi:hypothetical protein
MAEALRNGLVHEYAPKVGTRVWFVFEEEETMGLGRTAEFPLTLNIRPYFEHFRDAREALFTELHAAAARREGGSA